MHNHYSHLADSVDELKEAGVKGGHAKRLVARCSASETGRTCILYRTLITTES